MHVYFNNLYFAYFSVDFQYIGIKRMEICNSSKKQIKYMLWLIVQKIYKVAF